LIKLPEGSPINKVLQLKEQGQANTDIIRILQEQGFSFQQISEALNQAQTKQSVEAQPAPTEMQPSVLYDQEQPATQEAEVNPSVPAPSQPQGPVFPTEVEPQFWPEQSTISSQALGSTTEDVEEIAESIIAEKWQKVTEEIGDITSFKDKTSSDLEAIKQEILRVENRFENLQNSIFGKVKEYDQSVSDVSIEIKALGKLLSNIVTPLTNNVKQLESLIKDLRK
jgi:DNA-binding transcriptional MerR regulator